MPRWVGLWHLASFDAPAVAVVWSLAFAWSARARLPVWAPALLALMAWSVYVIDRLLDARTGLRAPQLHGMRERHFFHWRYRRTLVPLAALAILAAAGIVFVKMPPRVLAPDSLLGAAAFAYFSGVHSRRKLPRLVTKEFLVGVIFTAGCTLPALLRLRAAGAAAEQMGVFLVPAIYLAALAWLNCHAIAHWEADAATPGKRFSVVMLGCAHSAAGMLLAAGLAAHYPRVAALLVLSAVSGLALAVLDRRRERITPLALRAAADLVLLTPIFLVPLTRLLA